MNIHGGIWENVVSPNSWPEPRQTSMKPAAVPELVLPVSKPPSPWAPSWEPGNAIKRSYTKIFGRSKPKTPSPTKPRERSMSPKGDLSPRDSLTFDADDDSLVIVEDELSRQNLYKTELCRSFQETGLCRYGHKCQFAHGQHELRPVLRHPKYKTEICKTFTNTGACTYGNRCRFIHQTHQGQGGQQQQQSEDGWSTSWNIPDTSSLDEEHEEEDEGDDCMMNSRLSVFQQLAN